MSSRSLNKVQLIGNLTRDPELRYTPQGTAVCTFGLATNRVWATENGEKREETEFHRIVAWNKLAELCSQLLFKGRKVYVEGRLQTRTWTGQDGSQRQATEIIIEEMIILDSRPTEGAGANVAAKTAEPEPAEEVPFTEEPEAPVKEEAVSPADSSVNQPDQAGENIEEKKDDTQRLPEESKDSQDSEDADLTKDIPF
ncbi:MAG: single-stranded DNA-binding protein [Microgenomates group bacterium]